MQEKPEQQDMVSAADSRVLKFLAMARRSFCSGARTHMQGEGGSGWAEERSDVVASPSGQRGSAGRHRPRRTEEQGQRNTTSAPAPGARALLLTKASVEPKAQQEPQALWSRTTEVMLDAQGKLVRTSKAAGSAEVGISSRSHALWRALAATFCT